MAKESVNILKDKIDIVDLLAQLNAALSEEWLAFYQYWVGSFVVEGAMRGDVQREFQEHAAEEYNHAKLLADRIIELEGVPVLDPKQWFDLARCKYDAPVDFGSEILLKQNVESERCAIYRYQQIAEFTNGIYNPQIQISVVSGTKRSIFRQKNKTKRSKKKAAHNTYKAGAKG